MDLQGAEGDHNPSARGSVTAGLGSEGRELLSDT